MVIMVEAIVTVNSDGSAQIWVYGGGMVLGQIVAVRSRGM